MKVKLMTLALATVFAVSAHAAQETDPMVGCYTLPEGNFHIKITKSGGTYSTHFENKAGIDKSANLLELTGEDLEGLTETEDKPQIEKALAAEFTNDFFYILKFKDGYKQETDYMAVASMQFGGGPAMKVACK